MSHNKQVHSAYPSRNNISGLGNKGLLRQKPKEDAPESNHGEHVVEHMFRYIDRYLATKIGSPQARVAMDALKDQDAKVRAARSTCYCLASR